MSIIVLLFAVSSSIALPTIGRPGCPWSYNGSNEVIYFKCWNCPNQPGHLGCYGDCANPCNDAVTMEELEGGLYLVKVYDIGGSVIGSFYADSWEEEQVSLPEGDGIKMTFNIVREP